MLYIGKLVNTHGLKGEVRIISNFKYKNEVFKKGNILYINNDKLIIKSYRPHKNFDMLTFENINDINEVLKYKGTKIYINPGEYNFSGPVNETLYGLKVYNNNQMIGTLKSIENTNHQELFVIKKGDKEYLVPYVDEFIDKITKDGIYLKLIKGLIDED